MSLLNQIPQPNYQGGDSEEERLEAIFNKLLQTHGHGVTTISSLNSSIGLNLDRNEEQFFEAILAQNDLIETRQPYGSNYYTIKLSNHGFISLKRYGSYKKYILSTMNKEDILKMILSKLQDDSIKPITYILSEIGIDTSLAESYESVLKNRGFIQCSKQGCFLRPDGKAYLHGISDDYFHTKEDFNIEDYHEEASLKVDEIIDYLKKAELEREILFEEIQELKELSRKLNKKNWKQIVLGKMVDLTINKIIEKDTFNYIVDHLIGEKKLLW